MVAFNKQAICFIFYALATIPTEILFESIDDKNSKMTKIKKKSPEIPKKNVLVIQEKQWNNIIERVKRDEIEALHVEADKKMLDYLKAGSEALKSKWPENCGNVAAKESADVGKVSESQRKFRRSPGMGKVGCLAKKSIYSFSSNIAHITN